MSSYNDSVTWFLKEEHLRANLVFFTAVYAVTDTSIDYTDYASLLSIRSNQRFSVQEYNVERWTADTIILTLKPYVGTSSVRSYALVSTIDNVPVLIAKVVPMNDEVPSSYERVIKLRVPALVLGDTRLLPNFSTDFMRSTESPIGEEIVTVQEHHHMVMWGKGVSDKDQVPVLNSVATPRYLMSAKYGENEPSSNVISQVFGEEGSEYSTQIANSVGKIVEASKAGTLETEPVSRIITDTIAKIIANVMEEYIMANNSIQILGQAIPTDDSIQNLNTDKQYYFLYADKVEAADDRHLKATNVSTLRRWLVDTKKASKAELDNISSCITLIESEVPSLTITFTKTSQIAIVFNTTEVLATSGTKSVTAKHGDSSANATLYPSESVIFLNDSEGNVVALKSGASERIDKILTGEIGFSKLKFSSDPESLWKETSEGTTFKVDTTKKYVTVDKLYSEDLFGKKATFSDGFYIDSGTTSTT